MGVIMFKVSRLVSLKARFKSWNSFSKASIQTWHPVRLILLVVNQLRIYFQLTFFRCVTSVFLFLPKELKYLINPLSDGYILSSDMSGIFRQDIIKSCLPGRHSDF